MTVKIVFMAVGILLFAAGLAKYLVERGDTRKKKPRSIYETPVKQLRIEARQKRIRYIGYAIGAVIAVIGVLVAWSMWV